LGKWSKNYFHEDNLISHLNYVNCIFRPLVLLWSCLQVVIQSDYPGHFPEIHPDQSSMVVIDSVMQWSSNEINVILSTLHMNSILESLCFPLSDYECRMGKWLMSVRKFLAWLLPILYQMNKWLFWYWCYPHSGLYICPLNEHWNNSKFFESLENPWLCILFKNSHCCITVQARISQSCWSSNLLVISLLFPCVIFVLYLFIFSIPSHHSYFHTLFDTFWIIIVLNHYYCVNTNILEHL